MYIYIGKGAVTVKIIPPTWSQVASGTSYTVTRQGGFLFEFAPSTTVAREYDWTKKTTFFLDVTECGDLLHSAADGIDFMHDPNAQGPTAGMRYYIYDLYY